MDNRLEDIMKKNFRIWMVVLLVMSIIFSSITSVEAASKNKSLKKYRKVAERIEKKYGLNAIDSSKLTYEMITHRKHTVILERCIGKVKNKNKDGKVLNTNEGYYISYNGVKCKKGDIVITYFLWNPENNLDDDVIARWDYVIKK